MKQVLYILFIFVTIPLSAQWSVETVPIPKNRIIDNWVSNPDGIFSRLTEQQLEDQLESIEQQSGIEIAVVALGSIGDQVPHDFGLELFNTWGIGKEESNNGLLILLVKDQRRIEFITGYGLEGILTDASCYQIQQLYIIPRFKTGDYNGGIVAGVAAVGDHLLGDGWNKTTTPDDEAAFEAYADKLPKTLEAGQWLIDVDSLLEDSLRQQLNQKAAIISDSLGLEVRIAILDNLGVLSLWKASDFLRARWDISDKNIANHVFITIDFNTLKPHIYAHVTTSELFQEEEILAWISMSIRSAIVNKPQLSLGRGVEVGLNEIQRLYTDEVYCNSVRAEMLASRVPEPYYKVKTKNKKAAAFFWRVFIVYVWILGILLGLTLLVVFVAQVLIKDPYQKYHSLSFFALDLWMYIFPIPFLLVGLLLDKLRQQYRVAPRNDPKTGRPMELLDELEEDQYLKAGQITEEQINSINYDVWACADRKELLILPYKTIFSKYGRCPKCNYRTYYLEYNRTIVSATEYSSGSGEKKRSCKHCKHSRITQYTIPRISSSSSSSSSGGSSGGSFGGGSSGGGGAGSSW